jgi:spermidine/putrescine transport system substrate-binding protein
MRKFFIRLGIVLIWSALICGALYLPKWELGSAHSNTINVFAWGDILDPAVITDFENETGIKVNLNYYSSNEELIVKLKATGGEGYDLIIPSDYAVNVLIHEGLLKEIDKEKLNFWNVLNPNLLGHFFDPDNRYSIPFEWELFGFGIDKDYFKDKPLEPSWKMIFDPKTVDYKVTMINDPIEAVGFAAFYLFHTTDELNAAQGHQVRDLLVQQKQWVEAYANFRGDYFLATKNCAVAVASSSYIWRTMRLFDFVGFVVPKEGSFITIENLSIPKHSTKEKQVYRFINYLYRPQSAASHYHTYGFFPAVTNIIDQVEIDPLAASLFNSSQEDFSKYHFLETVLPQQEIRDIWVDVKSGN